MLESFFIYGSPPPGAEKGEYLLPLVTLSYAVAAFASYTALSLAQQLVNAGGVRERRLLHWGGAFAMGAGIWSMHFVGMLSYRMNMVMTYDPALTLLSMLIAIVVAYGALGMVARERLTPRQIAAGAILMGLGICGMHYTGMAAMRMRADLRYMPPVFLASFLIAVAASGVALWMAFTLARQGGWRAYLYRIGAALVMGAGICGMHYTGMAAAVIMPWADCRFGAGQNFNTLALAVAGITSVILALALAAGAYRRAQTEFQLQNSEKKLRALIDGALDAVVAMNQQGLVTEWNRQAEAAFGWSRGEAIGRTLADLIIPPEYRDAHSAGLARFLAGGAGPLLNRRVELTALSRHRGIFPVELAISTQKLHDGSHQFTAFIRDITERKRAEKAAGLLAAIVESSEDTIISVTLDGVITSWNAGASHLLGYTAEEAVGRSITLILPPDRLSDEKEIVRRVVTGESFSHYETVRLAKNGDGVDVSLTVSPIRDAAGEIVGASKILHDITARRNSDRRMQRYLHELERSNQELDDFAYIASHDLKEPLRGLHNNATFLMEDYGPLLGEDGAHRLQRLGYLAQRMENLVNDLLYFSRLGRINLAIQETDPNEIVGEIQQMMDAFLKERHARIVLPKPLPRLVCDKPRITEVFRNLITNAVKYNDKPERIVEIGFLERAETPDGPERNVFYVRDNGVGIDPKFHKEIFRIFRRLQQPEGEKETGTGVGLTFVKKIIERHDGRIWLESKPGEGATFYFNLNRQGNNNGRPDQQTADPSSR
jgi:two-component system, LuxR family, sensor kinase FixL